MEASGILALTCSLGASATAAGLAGPLLFEAFDQRFKGAKRHGDIFNRVQMKVFALRNVFERQMLRIPRFAATLNKIRADRKRRQIRKSLPEAIRLMCISLDSGSSLSKALEYAANNCSGAMAKELKTAVWEIQAGQTFEEAMERLRQRTGGTEFACLSVAMEIQYRCGGTLSGILEETSSMLQQISDLEDELVTKTTQAQLSARVVALMPLVILALLALISPGYLNQFFDSSAGIAMLVLALVLELTGAILVKRSLKVDVNMGEV